MTLLTPWTLQTNLNRNIGELIPIYGTSWNDFTNHMRKLNGVKNNQLHRSTFLERCELKYIHNLARNLKCNSEVKKISQNYRRRNATIWENE